MKTAPALLVAALTACAGNPSPAERPDEATFVCTTLPMTTRYRVDSVVLPTTTTEARTDGFPLDDTMDITNQLGAALSVPIGEYSPDFQPSMTADAAFAGDVDWEIEIETCADSGESRVRVGMPGGSASRAVGTLAGTTLTATAGCAQVPVGVLAGGSGSDAGWVGADQMSLALQVTATGLSGTIGWTVEQGPTSTAVAIAFAPFVNAESTQPGEASDTLGEFDTNGDGVITPAEIEATPLYVSLMSPDVRAATRIDDGADCTDDSTGWLSLGLGIHAIAE